MVDWEKALHGKNVNKQVHLFTETLTNIFNNFMPNKEITVKDKEPTWLNDKLNESSMK